VRRHEPAKGRHQSGLEWRGSSGVGEALAIESVGRGRRRGKGSGAKRRLGVRHVALGPMDRGFPRSATCSVCAHFQLTGPFDGFHRSALPHLWTFAQPQRMLVRRLRGKGGIGRPRPGDPRELRGWGANQFLSVRRLLTVIAVAGPLSSLRSRRQRRHGNSTGLTLVLISASGPVCMIASPTLVFGPLLSSPPAIPA